MTVCVREFIRSMSQVVRMVCTKICRTSHGRTWVILEPKFTFAGLLCKGKWFRAKEKNEDQVSYSHSGFENQGIMQIETPLPPQKKKKRKKKKRWKEWNLFQCSNQCYSWHALNKLSYYGLYTYKRASHTTMLKVKVGIRLGGVDQSRTVQWYDVLSYLWQSSILCIDGSRKGSAQMTLVKDQDNAFEAEVESDTSGVLSAGSTPIRFMNIAPFALLARSPRAL